MRLCHEQYDISDFERNFGGHLNDITYFPHIKRFSKRIKNFDDGSYRHCFIYIEGYEALKKFLIYNQSRIKCNNCN